MAPEPSDYWGWIAKGHYDSEWKVYDAYLKPEHTFIDLGAWVGAHSLYASRIAGHVLAIEPDPVAWEILLNNLNGCAPILRMAVGFDGEVILGSGCLGASTTRKNLAAGGGIGEAAETVTVRSISLRNLCADIPDPLFIKIDIEGMEEEVFKDWEFFHERKPAILVELHPWWWENEAETRENFKRVTNEYKTVQQVNVGLYFLEN